MHQKFIHLEEEISNLKEIIAEMKARSDYDRNRTIEALCKRDDHIIKLYDELELLFGFVYPIVDKIFPGTLTDVQRFNEIIADARAEFKKVRPRKKPL